jgi:hypothetical protein
MLTNSDWHLLFCVYWLLHFLNFLTEHKSIVNDVFDSHNLMVVTVLSTPHCQWCIYLAHIHSWVAAMGASVSVSYTYVLSVFLLICFDTVFLVHQLIHLSLGCIVLACKYNLEVSIYSAFSTIFSFIST